MKKLDQKYVLHLPVHKLENEKVTKININKVLDDLVTRLNKNQYHSFYITNVNGHYKSRSFDEILITIFTTKDKITPDKIFRKWFKENNHILKQESYAYEYNNTLYVENLEE